MNKPNYADLLRRATEYCRHPDYDWDLDFQREVDAALAAKPAQQDAPTDAVYARLHEIAYRDTATAVTVRAEDLRALLARYAPAQDAERERQQGGGDAGKDAGIEAAAVWVDSRREAFDREHGYEDPDTGEWEYGTGQHAEAKREYSWELAEIAEGLRALKSDAARAQRADKGDGDA